VFAVAGRLIVLLELLQLLKVRKRVSRRAGFFLLVAAGLFLGDLRSCGAMLGVFETLRLDFLLEAIEILFNSKLKFLAVVTLVLHINREFF
jgi:hypothetical protein